MDRQPEPLGGALAGRRFYLCTPDRADLPQFVDACIKGGVDIVQYRDKQGDARSVLKRGALVRDVCRSHGVPFILNDRPDLAFELGADGVHVGQDDCPPSTARRILGPNAIIGLSTHSQDDMIGSEREPVDYISVGPVNPTPTKPGRPGTGLGYLRYAVDNAPVPYYVTGGVNPHSIGDLLGSGATRFVAVRWLTEADDPFEAAKLLRRAIDTGRPLKRS
ncbi:MAG: thiamine phosphate synthase [Acidimicrobiales bacterium]|nr:thiamine phosphate synthase [Acidimicrobiales bacterium]